MKCIHGITISENNRWCPRCEASSLICPWWKKIWLKYVIWLFYKEIKDDV